ncbi:MAG: family 78 glycoside hydrolase catalytic domain, partial [Bacteroidetes bacterium]|nr:family 78 glycoside hydrolase catalytic domain [Bacteroidota bacterium]
ISGKKGSEIKLRFIEELGPTYGQTDRYILKGNEKEIWEPRFTWHAFRYIEVSGSSTKLGLDNIEGRVVNTDVSESGTFECSNNLLNQILINYQWTQLGNMHGGIPSDCPHRERRGYTGDGQISARAAIYNFDMTQFYTKWLNDISDAQNHVTGYVPNTSPYQDGGGGTAWGAAFIIIPWNMYLYYGDKQILKQHYAGMKHWIKYMQNSLDKNGILINQGLGEWVPPDLVELPADMVNTCYYFYCCKLMEKISMALGNGVDNKHYKKLSEKVRKAINREYFDIESKNYSIGRQGANILPLGFGVVNETDKKEVFNALTKNVIKQNHGHFDTGILSTPLLLEVLTELGRIDLAYTIMAQRDFPGFGDMIDQGATTIWETWQGEASHSHPMFGSVCQWFYQHIGGIVPSYDQPGFKHAILKPYPINRLTFAKTTFKSMYGNVKTDWKLENNDFHLQITIPANTSATVYVLAKNEDLVYEGTGSVNRNEHIKFLRMESPFAVFEVASGTYNFTSEDAANLLKTPVLPAPVITPGDTLAQAGDSVLVNIFSDVLNTQIRYTLDGSEPVETSNLFTKAFYVDKPTIVRAKVTEKGSSPGFEKKIVIGFIDPKKNGLNYNYYEGVWAKLPEFNQQKVIKRGAVYTPVLDNINPNKDEFGLVFTGNIKIEAEGEYVFYLMSNDGSKLFINDKLVIEHDGLHGADSEKSGKIYITKGIHPLKLEYFQAGGGMFLKLQYSSAGIEKQNIPATLLYKN